MLRSAQANSGSLPIVAFLSSQHSLRVEYGMESGEATTLGIKSAYPMAAAMFERASSTKCALQRLSLQHLSIVGPQDMIAHPNIHCAATPRTFKKSTD